MPVEVTNLTFELHLPVDSQYSLPVGALNLIVESKSLPVEVSNSTIEFYLTVDSQYSSPVEALHLIVESKSLPVEVNNSTIELHLACVAWRFLSGETAITNPKVARSLGERQLRNGFAARFRGFAASLALEEA